MNRYKLAKAGIDANDGIERFCDDPDAYEQMLYRFLAEPHFDRLREALAAGDANLAFEEAHALKGVVGNLSMVRMYEDICPLVNELRKGSLEGAGAMMEQLERDYSDILEALSQENS